MKKLTAFLLSSLLIFTSCEDEIIDPSELVLQGTLTEDKTLTKDKLWTLKGYVYVPEGVTLTIEEGTTIHSDIAEKGALIIERGGKIMAEGTSDEPIVFTSGNAFPQSGDWGGIVILGKAKTNQIEPIIEGGVGKNYGGEDDADNSGVLKYVRIEYAGIAAFANSEVNALTLAGVGSGTVVEYVECYYSFDDDYDFDFGYRGTIQYAISKRDPLFVDGADAGNGIECDNDGAGSTLTPTTKPTLLNFTLVGPVSPQSLTNHNLAMRFRRGTNFVVKNSVFYGYMKGGLQIESDITVQSFKDGGSEFTGNVVHSVDTTKILITKSPAILSLEEMTTKVVYDNNTLWTSSLSPVTNGFETVNGNVGAIPQGTTNWLLGWTKF